jgi:glycoprotein endo-alpha-1,2-mannosidase
MVTFAESWMLYFFVVIACMCIQTYSHSVGSEFENHGRNNIHTFYYLWYGNVENDMQYNHWNHEVLPHWTPSVNERYPQVGLRFEPPTHTHSPFYPSRGPYSSRDPKTILEHFYDIRASKIGVIVLSWWGQESRAESTDTQGVSTDSAIPLILSLAEQTGDIKVALHLEPYMGRSALSVREDIAYIHKKYGNYSSLLRTVAGRLVFYVYDSYHISARDWQKVMHPQGLYQHMHPTSSPHPIRCIKN